MTHEQLVAALERERASPEPPERIAGGMPACAPITPRRAAQNRARLDAALREADTRHRWSGRPTPAPTAPTNRTPLQSAPPDATALTSTT